MPNIRVYLYLAIAAGLLGAGIWLFGYITTAERNRIAVGTQAAVIEAKDGQIKEMLNDAKKLREANDQYENDNAILVGVVAAADGVRLHVPTCRDRLPKEGAVAGNSDGGGGVADTRIDDYLADTKRQIQDIGERCAKINIQARRNNAMR